MQKENKKNTMIAAFKCGLLSLTKNISECQIIKEMFRYGTVMNLHYKIINKFDEN